MIGFAAVGSIAAVLAYGILDDSSGKQQVLLRQTSDPSERPRCPIQPPVLDIGLDWVSDVGFDGQTIC